VPRSARLAPNGSLTVAREGSESTVLLTLHRCQRVDVEGTVVRCSSWREPVSGCSVRMKAWRRPEPGIRRSPLPRHHEPPLRRRRAGSWMGDDRVDPALSVQLAEATHALYRAALALESVQASASATGGIRCPFLAESIATVPGDDSVMLLPGDPAFDAALAGIIEADDEPEGVEATDAGPANVLASEGLSFVTPEPDAGQGHRAPSEEFLQNLATELNANVVRGIFEAGLLLHGLLQRTTDQQVVERIEEVITVLDETIRETRAVVFGLAGNGG